MHKTTIYLPDDVRRRLEAAASDTGRSQAEVIRAALRAYVGDRPGGLPASIGSYRGGAFAAERDEAVLDGTWGRPSPDDRDHAA